MMKLSESKKISIGAMVIALNVVILYAASVLPTGRLACYFISSLFIYALICERAFLTAFVSFAATVGIGFMLLPNKTALIPYALLLGHYGLFKRFIDLRIEDGAIRLVIKLLYCNLFTGIGVGGALAIFGSQWMEYLPQIPVWLLVIIAQAAFILLDYLYALCQRFYEARIRKFIAPRR